MKPKFYVPSCLRAFQGFFVKDIKDWQEERRVEVHLEREVDKKQTCHRCRQDLDKYHDQYRLRVKHLQMMGWQVDIIFFREKRYCDNCKKIRSEHIEWLCPANPHTSMELSWWLNRLTEVTSVLSASRLESIDKKTCYRVDKYVLKRLFQGYKIPDITKIAVDEVYARGKKQQKEGETRDDLFLTVVIDLKTKKVIWVSQSRRKEALDKFFEFLGEAACNKIEAVATDQHDGYGASVRENCKNATQIWDRFHLVQNFNKALNEDRKVELSNIDPKGEMEDLMNGKYRYIFLTKAENRTKKDQRHIQDVMRLNRKMTKLEMIKEHFHKMFDCNTAEEAQVMLNEIYQWSFDANAGNIWKWVKDIREKKIFWNYWKYKVSTGISEGMNRVIKGLKWQAYGYKDMAYFALKILQKCGYLNSRYHGNVLPVI